MEDDDTALASRPANFRKLDKYPGQSARTLWVWPSVPRAAHAHTTRSLVAYCSKSYNNNMVKI